MSPWLRYLEAWAVQQLLRTPAFHRGVEKVARTVHRVTHGVHPEEMGGTKIDSPASKEGFLRYFSEEIQTQLGRAEARIEHGAEKNIAATTNGRARGVDGMKEAGQGQVAQEEEETAESVWRNAQRNSQAEEARSKGFLGEYVGALKEQMRLGK